MWKFAKLSAVYSHVATFVVNAISKRPTVVTVGIVMSAYVLHYVQKIAAKPVILVKQKSKFHRFLMEYCPILKDQFKPTIWCYNTYAQTVLRPIMHMLTVKHFDYERELLDLPDGGVLALDHFGSDLLDDSDIVVILTGLTGSSEAEYIKQFCWNISSSSRRAIVMNYRGQGGVELKTCRTYCSTHTEDFEFALKYIQKKNPQSRIMAMGISLGGMILTHFLRKANDPIMCAGLAISPAWKPSETTISLEKPVNWFLFNRYLLNILINMVKPYHEFFQEAGYNMDQVVNSNTIRDFDTHFTSKVFGYKDTNEYYEDAAIEDKLHTIKIPMLYLNAADDVFCPRHTINDEFLKTSSNVACILTNTGGHIGFMDGFLPRRNTYMNRLFMQFMNAIFEHGHEIEDIHL